jgi:DNA-binding NarL/FixJ family response regulator
MPFYTGLQIAERCKEANISTKIVLITFEKDEKIYKKAKELGVYGYVLKEFALDEIEHCISSVLNERPYFSPELLTYIKVDEAPKALQKLTKTELKILKLITENKIARDIAEELFISKRTVEKHKSNIITKLGIQKTKNCLLIWAKDHQNYLQ